MNTENRKNLQEISNVIRKLLGLSQPIQLSELKDIMVQKFGANLIAQKGCKPTLYVDTPYGYEDCKSTLYSYQVTYNPDCSEREQLSSLAAALEQIMRCEQTKDSTKYIYTGGLQLLDKEGTLITDSDIIDNVLQNVVKAEAIGEILFVFAKHSNDKPDKKAPLSVAYDFQSETMVRCQTKDKDIYYIKMYKK